MKKGFSDTVMSQTLPKRFHTSKSLETTESLQENLPHSAFTTLPRRSSPGTVSPKPEIEPNHKGDYYKLILFIQYFLGE